MSSHMMHHAAAIDDTDPDRLSFTTALRAVRRWISSAATTAALAAAHAVVLAEISQDHNHRRQRSYPRVVKTLPGAVPRQTPRSITSIHQRRIRHHCLPS